MMRTSAGFRLAADEEGAFRFLNMLTTNKVGSCDSVAGLSMRDESRPPDVADDTQLLGDRLVLGWLHVRRAGSQLTRAGGKGGGAGG